MARALAADPPVLLMDEPFAAVDPIVRARLQDEFLRLQEELGKTVVLVTHDIDEAVKMGDKVAVLAQGGHLAQFATPAELLGHPADDFVADFVGSTAGLRRLTVTKLDPAHLEPLDGVATGDLAAAIDLDSTLEQALAVLLRDDKADGRRARTAPGSSASSPPTASTAPSAPPSPSRRRRARKRRVGAKSGIDETQCGRPRSSSCRLGVSSVACAIGVAARGAGAGPGGRDVELGLEGVVLRAEYAFSSSSSATRTIASAARWSESSRATASREPSASASSARRVSA